MREFSVASKIVMKIMYAGSKIYGNSSIQRLSSFYNRSRWYR